MNKLKTWAAVAVLVAATGTANAGPMTSMGTWWGTDGTDGTLKARDIDRNEVALDSTDAYFFYDTVLDLTWLRDWNAGAGTSFDNGSNANDGLMTWANAKDWASSLDINGLTGWRLPELSGPLNTTFAYTGTDYGYNVNTANSELAHMFYVTLGNLSISDTSGSFRGGSAGVDWGLTNTAYFADMQSYGYWSGTEYAPDPSIAWYFDTLGGNQGYYYKNYAWYAVAVRPGDVLAAQAVPEPGTLALLLAAVGVGAVVRRRRAH